MQGGLRSKNINKTQLPGKPLVSIVTVVLNSEKFLEQTIQSVLDQSYQNIEYIIIDGGSKDNTLNIIRKYENRIDYWESEKDNGIYFAMNKGISRAKGEIIGILNSDDYYSQEIIKEIVSAFESNNAGIVHGNMVVLGGNDEQNLQKPDISLMNQKPSVFHPTCFVKKEVYDTVGMFDPKFKISSDYEFLLRCIRKNISFSYLDKTITYFRPGGMSAKCASNIEGYRIMKIHNTGYHKQVIWRGIKCYAKQIVKKILNLKK